MLGSLSRDCEYCHYLSLSFGRHFEIIPKHLSEICSLPCFQKGQSNSHGEVSLFDYLCILVGILNVCFAFGMAANCMCLIVLMKNTVVESLGGRKPPF